MTRTIRATAPLLVTLVATACNNSQGTAPHAPLGDVPVSVTVAGGNVTVGTQFGTINVSV